ncbi:MAG TPA: glycosyltransferase family 4 protein [Nitrososphaerales archaeon]|nr:glycosyltransferase family 4 protein [Nitrososphaerales archaeon]HUK74302.1 glycosyltransferase family 4 protein [Nitrososphaerales archaeon]
MGARVAITGVDMWAGGAGGMSGSFRAVYEVAKRLSNEFEVTMVFLKDGHPSAGRAAWVEGFRTVECAIGRPPIAEFPRGFLEGFDLLQVWGASRAALHTRDALSLPHCHSFHSSLEARGILSRLEVLFDRATDTITAAGTGVKASIASASGLPVEVIPLGVDANRFRPLSKEDARDRVGVPRDAFVFGFLGRLWKLDFSLTYSAFRRVKALTGREDCVLVAAGQYDRLRMRGPCWVKDDFVVLSCYPHSEVPSILNSFDVFLNTACGVREGFGLSVLEAMACGVPVVSVAWDGFRDTVADGETGLLVDTAWHAGEPWVRTSQLVDACSAVLRDDAMRARMGRRAREVAARRFTWELCGRRYARLFRGVMDLAVRSRDAHRPERPWDPGTMERLRRADGLPENLQRAISGLPSSRRIGNGWERTVCDEVIDFLPKYCGKRDSLREMYHERLARHFPSLRS